MVFYNQWKEPILFVLVVLGTFFNILWSIKRVAALKAQVTTLKDQLRFWEKLTPGEVSKHFGRFLDAIVNKNDMIHQHWHSVRMVERLG